MDVDSYKREKFIKGEAGAIERAMEATTVNTEKLLYMIGFIIFGGMFLSSIIDANFYIEEYSPARLLEFRLFAGGGAIVYFTIVFLMNRKQRRNS
ncbi:hypothetical protein AB685_28035 [Bacillus sp. LL01]|uniref:hypothetical protein n=1 Tax=Bacillus sp. LL01 TaxID=1665556 RepID=UPI00064D1AAD|nr:hypothetical protein [Bacillus sp. LL01]KMJ55289.1 hypothetical protein AB685_28035 [Bacillus sp. LL01]